ncbi:tail fiber/spike domain-containing protein [Enterobacter soli]|uniref:tail fiber/spike domain-containing protein n=1 Tax=Enterobacter soli TaxID=885040 RepID=UPI00372E3959
MTTYATNNSLGSTDPRDLYDNSQNFDHLANDQVNESWNDRFGNPRKTWHGIETMATDAIEGYGWILMDSFQAGATLTLPNQALRDTATGEYYRWDGSFLPSGKIVPVGSTPATAGGVGIGAWVSVGDAALRSALASSAGGGMIGMPQGGTLAQNLVTVSVDAFGADPTGATDSSPAVIAALQSVYGTTLDSKYYALRTKYVQILFGNGTYMLGDIPLISGTDYVGQGRWATRIIPKAGASYVFKTVGTQPAADAGGGGRYWCGHIRDMLIGDRYLSTGLPQNVGAIYMSNTSHFRLERVDIVNIDGCGLDLAACWDSQFYALKIVGTGNTRDSANPVPALRITYVTGSAGVKEGSNALMFYGLHIELCPQQMQLDYVAHVLFSGGKFEGGPTANSSWKSSTIHSSVEVCFANAEFTWHTDSFPMYNMITTTSDNANTGIHFSSPRLVSQAAVPSWYFYYASDVAPLLISNITARNVSKLITGSNFVIDGGVTYNCGPTIANITKEGRVIDLVCRQVPAISTTADNTFILAGTGCEISGCFVQCAGSNSDGAACIQIASGATDAKVFNNVFTGAKQYGILQNGTVTSRYIRDNVLGPGANITTLLTGSTPLISSNLASTPVTIASGAAGTVAVIGRACMFSISAALGSTTASCIVHSDSTGTKLVIMAETSSGGTVMFQTGTGAAGDGTLRLTKSGGTVTLTNNTGSNGAFVANIVNIQ